MSKVTKVILITAGALILVGLIVSAIGIVILRNSVKKNDKKVVYEHKEEVITEDFTDLNLSEISETIEIKPSEDGQVRIDYYDAEKYIHKIEVKNNTLELYVKTYEDNAPWWERFSFHFDIEGLVTAGEEHPTTIYLPEDSYGSLTISTVSGEVIVPENYSFEGMSVSTTSGDVVAECIATGTVSFDTTSGNIAAANINATSLDASSTSGELSFTDTKVSGGVNINSVSGTVTLKDVKSDDLEVNTVSGEIYLTALDTETASLTTTSGDISGTIAGDHEYEVDTTSGDIDLPSSIKGESLIEIDTVSGDVSLDAAA